MCLLSGRRLLISLKYIDFFAQVDCLNALVVQFGHMYI